MHSCPAEQSAPSHMKNQNSLCSECGALPKTDRLKCPQQRRLSDIWTAIFDCKDHIKERPSCKADRPKNKTCWFLFVTCGYCCACQCAMPYNIVGDLSLLLFPLSLQPGTNFLSSRLFVFVRPCLYLAPTMLFLGSTMQQRWLGGLGWGWGGEHCNVFIGSFMVTLLNTFSFWGSLSFEWLCIWNWTDFIIWVRL